MPSTSKSQQRLFGWALACKQGKSDNCPVNIKKLGDSMSVEELEKMAKTKHEDLPEKVKEALAEAYSTITPDQLGILLEGFAGMGTVPEGNLSLSGNPAPPPGIKAAEKGTGSGDVHDKSITPSLFKMPGEKQGKHERRVLSFDEFLKTINYKTHDDTLQKGHGQNLTGKG